MIVACTGIIIDPRKKVNIRFRPLNFILAKAYAANEETISCPPVPMTTIVRELKNTLQSGTVESFQTVE